MMKISILFGLLMLTLGCSTYSKRQCQNFNWEMIGRDKAIRGDTLESSLAHYQKACGEHKISVSEEQFQKGYQSGIQILCSSEGGQNLGRTGFTYKGTCPKNLEDSFLKGYTTGKVEYMSRRIDELERKVKDLESEVSSKDREISNLESEVSSLKHKSCP